MNLENHKHCKNCGTIIIPSNLDCRLKNISYNHPTLSSLRFRRDVAYGNCFCEECIIEYGLIDLVNHYKRIKIK